MGINSRLWFFAVAVARALDIAPFREGECLDSKFRDDSAAGKGVMPSTVDVGDGTSTQTTIAGVQGAPTVPTQTTTP